jgi:hypothetical protein
MACSFVAYVDEAGDDGLTAKGSEWFVLSALVTNKANEAATLKGVVDPIRISLSKPVKTPLHFRKIKHHQRVPYIAQIAAAPVRAINVLVHKPSLLEPETFGEEHRLYHYAVRLLVERISWLCRDAKHTVGDGTVDLVFSNRGGMSYSAISEYLDSLIANAGLSIGGSLVYDIRIAEGTMNGGTVSTFSHGKRMGLQVADAVASGLYNALEAKYGFTEDRYARMLKPVMYNYRGRYRGYGLKFFPPEAQKLVGSDARLNWVVEDYPK